MSWKKEIEEIKLRKSMGKKKKQYETKLYKFLIY